MNYKAGITLIEVLMALIIFSAMIAFSSNYITAGLKMPYVLTSLEEWLNFIETSPQELSTHLPSDIKNWSVKWQGSNLRDYKVANISAQSNSGIQIQWNVYVKRTAASP